MCLQCLSNTGPVPAHDACAVPAHTAQPLGCSARNRPRLALGRMHLPGLSRSGSGTWVVLRGADSGWACILCPSQVQAAQVIRCFASTVTPRLGLHLILSPRPSHSVFWVYNGRTFSDVPCVSSGELISGYDPPGECQPSRIPRNLG